MELGCLICKVFFGCVHSSFCLEFSSLNYHIWKPLLFFQDQLESCFCPDVFFDHPALLCKLPEISTRWVSLIWCFPSLPELAVVSICISCHLLEQGLASSFCKWPDSKYFSLCELCGPCQSYSALVLQSENSHRWYVSELVF